MTRSSSATAMLLAAVALLVCLLASPAAAAVSEKLPSGLSPCFYYPSDNKTRSDVCGTNDAWTLALDYKKIQSVYGKLQYDETRKNINCEKTLNDQAACLGPANVANNCVWFLQGVCQSNRYVTTQKVACDKSKAQAYFKCLASYTTKDACEKDSACAWAPQLADFNSDPNQNACYAKEVAKMSGTEWQAWALSKGPLNTDKKAYDAYWGTCATAKAAYNEQAYRTGCTTAKDKDTCDERLCMWSAPFNENKCIADRSRAYALRFYGAGLIREQFMQCFSPSLVTKGKKACMGYTLA